MADADHPKTRIEDQDVDLPRTQPESPKHEGIDPLAEDDTMYSAEETKTESEQLDRLQEKKAAENVGSDEPTSTPETERAAEKHDASPAKTDASSKTTK